MRNAARSTLAELAVTRPPTGVSRLDRALAVIVLAAVTIETFSRPDPRWWAAATMSLGVILAGAFLVRRAHSLAAVSLAFGAFLAVDVLAFSLGAESIVLYSGVVVLALVYSLTRWASARDIVFGMAIIVAEFTVSTITDFSGEGDVIGGVGVLLFAATLGAAIRYRAIAHDQLVAQVRLQEREYLARDLHDVVAHHVSAIATQAQAGQVLARVSPGSEVVESLAIIEHEAAKALSEMRTMVDVLRGRNQQDSYSPGKRLTDIEQLASGDSGSLRVDVELQGDLNDLPAGVEMALYRVAQEAITNARRHARLATWVRITVIGNANDVQLHVSDDGTRTTNPKSTGYGLVGMTERISLLDGTLTTGPGLDRGWLIHASLPRSRQEP